MDGLRTGDALLMLKWHVCKHRTESVPQGDKLLVQPMIMVLAKWVLTQARTQAGGRGMDATLAQE